MGRRSVGEIKKDKYKNQYLGAKERLLIDESINEANRDWFKQFFEKEETLLKRKNGLIDLDENNFKTLYKYIFYLKNTNNWFNNKPHNEWVKEDIQRVYEDLEDGKIKNFKGERIKDRRTYYSKVFKSLPFRIIGKDTLAREVIEYTPNFKEEVRFIYEKDFRKLVGSIPELDVKALMWVLWDYGENIRATLKLTKADFQEMETDGQPEYRIWWRKEILKRSRRERGELNNYPDTYKLLKEHLSKLSDDERVFKYTYYQIGSRFNKALTHSGIKTTPKNDKVQIKDLRSGMACDLLIKGWELSEVNKRLGHSPSSREIDKYVNFLALESKRPKKKLEEFEVNKLKQELETLRQENKLKDTRYNNKIADMELKVEKLIDSVMKKYSN